jgi:hypothetical protein
MGFSRFPASGLAKFPVAHVARIVLFVNGITFVGIVHQSQWHWVHRVVCLFWFMDSPLGSFSDQDLCCRKKNIRGPSISHFVFRLWHD